MRLLLIHSDYIEYKAQKKTAMAEEDIRPQDSFEDALTAFCAVESVDEEDIGDVVSQAAGEILGTAEKVGAFRVMIYPYAHLSTDLASPQQAVHALVALEKALEGSIEVKRAPFGWYKSFTISCKGHPLSELSRTILPGGSDQPKKEVAREWFVLTPEGERKDIGEYQHDSDFSRLIAKETGSAVSVGGEPVHVDLMRAKELVDYEVRSDVGNLRWLPRGKLIRDLLADYCLNTVLEYGGSPVETPVMYDLGDPAINEHAGKFGERQYRFKSNNRNMMLRFAACFGMFSIMHDMHISPNNLPMKMYELSTYSFRHEQKGEVIGLKRLRTFTMPDMHTLTKDMADALSCFEEQLMMGWKSGEDLGTPLEGVFRCTRDFYEDHADWVQNLARISGRPLLIEIISNRVHYWIAKIDLAAIDSQDRPIENPTVQIDVESAERFAISYTDRDGAVVHPPILHCSPTGSIERVICAILEGTARMDVPSFPVWLAPTQVRVLPVSQKNQHYADMVYADLKKSGIRADLDDRDESVGKKIRDAGMDWVPYVVVIGDKEESSGLLTVTVRAKSEPKKPYKEQMTPDELIAAIRSVTAGLPFRPLYTQPLLSKKPHYI
ncbi:MAG: threonine--tRNA ligase [Methanocalculus sp. MSAO_Arc1]|uniref:threonine--tRNA ligase n=1 Tax=Methanocalculus TaxID=71151 RepID=UPI000FEF8BEC|nr:MULTISPECIES: threonine--tRNA ligase [unclassified Methanocalculus]MCP1661899.1 threonyl-tRNA synthetase [Methanocalculus sp. AMF5]RQD81214.1 MAG: threonine--tRNA ligase [Methanocalculus sp. MSAO_Arc1]